MTIGDIVKQGLHYARTCKSLWLFGFFVGITSGGSSGGAGGGNGGGASVGVGPVAMSIDEVGPIVIVFLLAIVATFVIVFVSEGALIEGVARIRRGGTMTTREGFRAGWAHWGVLLRIALAYLAALVVSLVLIAAPCVLAWRALGPIGGVALLVPMVIVAVPWLVTLHLVQAFAARIAVLEERHAIDAIRNARLFLHGRLTHGLKLIVATFLGTCGIAFLGLLAIAPVALLLFALIPTISVVAAIVVGCLVLLPALFVLTAMVGILRSSIWTVGYMTQVNA